MENNDFMDVIDIDIQDKTQNENFEIMAGDCNWGCILECSSGCSGYLDND